MPRYIWLICTWRGVTHSYVTWLVLTWHDSFLRGMTWLILTWHDVTHSYVTWHDAEEPLDDTEKVSWYVWSMWHDACDTTHVTWRVWLDSCDMTHTWRDSFERDIIWRRGAAYDAGNMPRHIWLMWHDMTWLILTWRDVTRSYVTWLVLTWHYMMKRRSRLMIRKMCHGIYDSCGMTHVTRLMRDVTHSYVT